jgi:hypothetical protein
VRAQAGKRCRQLGRLHRGAAPNGRAVQCTAPAHSAESPAWPQLTVQEALHSPSTHCRRLAWPSTQWRKLAWPSTQYRKCEVSHQTTIVGDCADRQTDRQTGILVVAQDTLHWQWCVCVCVHRVVPHSAQAVRLAALSCLERRNLPQTRPAPTFRDPHQH